MRENQYQPPYWDDASNGIDASRRSGLSIRLRTLVRNEIFWIHERRLEHDHLAKSKGITCKSEHQSIISKRGAVELRQHSLQPWVVQQRTAGFSVRVGESTDHRVNFRNLGVVMSWRPRLFRCTEHNPGQAISTTTHDWPKPGRIIENNHTADTNGR